MYSRAKTSAFVLGLVGGILNGIFAIFALIGLIVALDYARGYMEVGQIILFLVLVLVCILNLVGACVCRNRRTAGGVLMLVSSILLLITLVLAAIGLSLSSIGMFSEGAVPVLVIWLTAQVLSVIGAILCFTGPAAPAYMPQYGQPYPPYAAPYQPYGQPQQPYGAPYYGQPQQPAYQQPYQPPQQPPQQQ